MKGTYNACLAPPAPEDRRRDVAVHFAIAAVRRLSLLTILLPGLLNTKVYAIQVTVDASESPAVEYFTGTPRESFVRFRSNDSLLFPIAATHNFDLTIGLPETVDINYLQLSAGTNDGSFDVETHTVSYTATVENQSAEIVYDITAKLVGSNQFQFDYHLLSPETVRFNLAPDLFLDFSPLPEGSGPLGQVLANNSADGSITSAIFEAELLLGVPEPSSGVLLTLGGMMSLVFLRRPLYA